MNRHKQQRRINRDNPNALSVGAIHHIIGRPMPAPTGAGRHRSPEGDDK